MGNANIIFTTVHLGFSKELYAQIIPISDVPLCSPIQRWKLV